MPQFIFKNSSGRAYSVEAGTRGDKRVGKRRAWKEIFNSLPENEQGNRDISTFSIASQEGKSLDEKLRAFMGDNDIVFLVADDY
eukprot:12132170-Ditylum_brightwellii.AAC.1